MPIRKKNCGRLPISYPKLNAPSFAYYVAVKASVGQSLGLNVANGLHVCSVGALNIMCVT